MRMVHDRMTDIAHSMESLASEIHALRASNRTLRRIVVALVSIVAFIGVVILGYSYLLYWPVPAPLVFNSLTVAPGQSVKGPLVYKVGYCRYNTSAASVTRNILGVRSNHYNYTFAAVSSIARNGCSDANLAIQLPPGVKPGTYTLADNVAFQIHTSPYRIVNVRATSNRFTLTP